MIVAVGLFLPDTRLPYEEVSLETASHPSFEFRFNVTNSMVNPTASILPSACRPRKWSCVHGCKPGPVPRACCDGQAEPGQTYLRSASSACGSYYASLSVTDHVITEGAPSFVQG